MTTAARITITSGGGRTSYFHDKLPGEWLRIRSSMRDLGERCVCATSLSHNFLATVSSERYISRRVPEEEQCKKTSRSCCSLVA